MSHRSYSLLTNGIAMIVTTAFAVTSLAEHAVASDRAVVERLESLGGNVVMKSDAVTELSFRDSSKLGDAEWRLIGSLPELQKLTAYGGARGLNDETVGHLIGLQKLESLSIDGAQLSDVGLARLADMTSLKSVAFFHLSFRKEGFTGKGFSAWKKLTNLERLTVAGVSMGDDGFVEIGQLKSLREFRTWHTYRTEASHTELAKLPKLTSLKLGQRLPHGGAAPCLTDQSLSTLVKIQTLESLEIGEARFTLESLKQLKRLPKLKRLKIDRTEISAVDIETLRSEMPGVKVEFEPLTDEQRQKLESYLR
ncbi:MAG: hypothetical protein HQ518_04730 [Rhodopirellula sp.]|nr:hypothetical protein [Rhodopirellula sp.]